MDTQTTDEAARIEVDQPAVGLVEGLRRHGPRSGLGRHRHAQQQQPLATARQLRTACGALVVRVLLASDLGAMLGTPGGQVLDGGEQGAPRPVREYSTRGGTSA